MVSRTFLSRFYKDQRRGMFAWILLLFILQITLFGYYQGVFSSATPGERFSFINSSDSLSGIHIKESEVNLYSPRPFNPNFISDYVAGRFGMSMIEIQRLRIYREKGLYVNSAKEFQEVTKVSDSVINLMQDYFKFPEWTQRGQFISDKKQVERVGKNARTMRLNLNHASLEDLVELKGIGEAYAKRILDFRSKLGGFVDLKQIEDVYQLSDQAKQSLYDFSYIDDISMIKKWNINTMSIKELSECPYFNYQIAREIVRLRSSLGDFVDVTALNDIKGFPIEKLNIIILYLEFEKK